MASNSNGSYTFYPEFSENVILYRGADKVFIGDGTNNHLNGHLYAQFVDEAEKELGPVSAYALAVQNGYTGTLTQWVAEIANASINAQDAKSARDTAIIMKDQAIEAKQQAVQAQNTAEAWATGGANGTPSSTNNAAYYSVEAAQARQDARDAASRAASWATGGTSGNPSATNNSLYYASQAGNAAANAQAWATGGSNGTPDSTNNALYYANQAHVWTTGALNDGSTGGASNNAKYYAEKAQAWATGSSIGNPSPSNNAKYYADEAKTMYNQTVEYYEPMEEYAQQVADSVSDAESLVDEAEMWATGQTGGRATATNNAKYYAQIADEKAKKWAIGPGQNTSDETYQNNAKYYSEQASINAQRWVIGPGNNPSDETYENNAKYYAEQANVNAQRWAIGPGNNTSDETYHNNAKYYSEQASINAQKWAIGPGEDTSDETYENNAKYYAEQAYADAQRWAIGPGQDSSHETYENNAKYYSELAKSYSDNVESVTATTLYYSNGINGTIPPADGSGWISVPDPQEGKYIWSKTIFTWADGTSKVVYNVGYIGANGTGAVKSVNGQAGDVVFDATSIVMDESVEPEEKQTIQQYINELEDNLQAYADAAGSVKNVNGVEPVDGTVSIDASDIYVDKNQEVEEGEERRTLMDYITSIEPVYATNAEIDALFEEEVGA